MDDARTVGFSHALERGHLLARSGRRAEIELHDLAFLRQLDLLDLVERFHAALHLRGLGRVRRKAIDEALFLREHRLLARVRRLAIRLANRSLPLVEVVVAGVARDLAAVDLGDLGDDAVHEIAVVRRHQERTGPRLEESLEPENRLDVQVVRRLVHQQDVGLAKQHARHGHAHLPPAR